jgi:hypothetical protein
MIQLRPQQPALPSPQRSRSRRERRNDASRQPVLHVLAPGIEVARAVPRKGETISAFLRRAKWATRDRQYGWQFRKGLPTILEINGEGVWRADWTRRRIAANDNVRFVSVPLGGQGGGAKQVLGLVALVAVSAFAFWAGPALAGAIGLTGTAATIAGGLATAAIAVGGSLLINSLVAPKPGATNTPSATQDQIYTVTAQGNTARLGQPLPVWYGRFKSFPDFAATPWGEFVGNDQYLNILLSTSMGSLAYETVYVDDTIFWDSADGISPTFAGAQIAFYQPGETVTLFPVNVDASSEVTGQQLPDGSGSNGGQFGGGSSTSPGPFVGGFVANPSGTKAQSIAVDFVFPSGCFTVDTTNNNIGFASVTLTAEYATCDDAGAQTSPYVNLFTVTRSFASTSPIRDSVKTDVSPARYLVRFRREDAALSGTQGASGVIWAGLRSFLQGANSFADVSTVAIRILATQSTQGSYKFGVLATRKLPVWNGSAFVTQATRNPGWAFLDAVTNAQYGSTLPIAKVDFNAVVNFAAGCTTRGDTFDYIFSAAVAVPDALDKILTPARARHFWLGDTVSIVRDEWRDVPSMLLTDREIARGSTQVTFTMLGDEDPDAVVLEYVDENTWLPAQVQYPPDSELFTASNPETKRVDGVVNRAQAFRECAFYYLQSIYRRESVDISTEYEGRAITLGAVLRLQSELPMAYGQGGAVTAVAAHALMLNPAPVWDEGPFYIRLRMPNGTLFGPVLASQGASSSIANLDATSLASAETAQSTTLLAVLAREDGAEYPSFEFGNATSESKLCVVLNGTPNGQLCNLSLVIDDIRVHATDLGAPPILPTSQFPANDKVPLLIGLNASFGQGTAEPKLGASWFPTAGAIYYVADVSYDGGASWTQVYQGIDNKFTALVTLAALRLRVQAVGAVAGPYSTVDLDAPSIVISSQTVALSSLIDGLKYQVTTLQDQLQDKIDEATQLIASLSSNQDSRNWLDKKQLRSQLAARSDAAFAAIDEVQTVAVDTQTAFAEFSTTVSATFGPAFSSVSTVSDAVATLDGYAAASWGVSIDVDGNVGGIELVNGSDAFPTFTVTVNQFQVASPGHAGGAATPIFTVGNVGGLPKVGIRGDMFIDGSMNITALNAGTLTAISAHFGTATVDGQLSSANGGKLVLDFTSGFLDIFD